MPEDSESKRHVDPSDPSASTQPIERIPQSRLDREPFRPGPYPNSPSDDDPIPARPIPEPTPDDDLQLAPVRSFRAGLLAIFRNWPFLVPLLLLTVSALVIPTMANVSTTDDWAYTRSVELLYYDSQLTMFPVVAATAIGQVFWAGLFTLIFGMELWVMRLSTIVIVGLGGVALYSVLRQLGVSKSRSTLGMALYLFNPLTFILAFTFMTDPQFASVMLFSVAFYVWGVRPGQRRPWAIVAGSFFAGYAFWIRQQGALIPLSVIVYLLMTRQLWFNWPSIRRVSQVVILPAAMLIMYYAWLYWVNDVPDVQTGFLDRARGYGLDGTWQLVRHMTYIEMAYLGFFLLPLTLAVLPGVRARMPQPMFSSPIGYWTFVGWTAAAITGMYLLTRDNRRMPYIGQFLGAGGFGPGDIPGPRRRLVEWLPFWDWLTVLSIIGAILLGLVLSRKIVSDASPERAAAGLVAMICLWQVIGMIPPSFQYLTRGGSLDRYLLPMIPLVIALAFWSLRDVRLVQPLAWLGVAVFAVVSTAGTRDFIVYMDSVWTMARYANSQGVVNEQLDAGSGWDGYHLYTDMLDQNITRQRSPGGSPWWINFYAKQTDSTYIVSTEPNWRKGYIVVTRKEYDQWLEEDPVYVYLLRRVDAPWPPDPYVEP